MARLPQVGGDEGNWGAVLNDFLLETHTEEGILKPGSVTTSQIADNAVTASKLSPTVQNALIKADASISNATAQATFIKTVNGTGPNGAGDVSVNSGPQGPQGAQGATGSQGATGANGTQGSQGSQGFQGAAGSTGSQGASGAAGAQGAQGAAGSNGAQGATGTIGVQGAQGFQGAIGSTGSQGTQGTTGSNGAQGPQGFQGATGSNGAQGVTGTTGLQGSQGFQGATGSTGNQGAQGAAGSNGAQGAQGSQGNQGFQGTQGATPVITGTATSASKAVATGSITAMTLVQNTAPVVVGDRIRFAITATPTNWMEGTVTANASGVVAFTSDIINGSGSATAWTWTSKLGGRGAQGFQGTLGTGVPTAGSTGQMLVKNSATNYDTAWSNPSFARVIVSTGSEARPSAAFVLWVGGSTQPTNMSVGDVWMKA